MGSIYKNGKHYYLSVSLNGKRITRSLGTSDISIAKQLKPITEKSLMLELMGLKKRVLKLTFPELARRFLKGNNHWSKTTYDLNESILRLHIEGRPLPANPTSRSVYIRHINQCWRWGLRHGLVEKADYIPGPVNGQARHRTFTKAELGKMFRSLEPIDFNRFIKLAYYTGARRGEICSLSPDNILDESLVVFGKTGRRYIKLNSQAQKLIKSQNSLWDYKRDYVTHKFKKEVRRLEIKNARFHDLRRTFGLNLIKQGMSIYKVSKLLGHSSVKTTEQHYAPLMTVDIEDFKL